MSDKKCAGTLRPNQEGCPPPVSTGACTSTCNCPAACSAEDDFTGLLNAARLNPYKIDFLNNPTGENWTNDDLNNAHKYAMRRLCVEAGFRLKHDLATCEGDCGGAPSYASPHTLFCGFRDDQCGVASTSTVDRGNTCMYGGTNPVMDLPCPKGGDGAVSAAQWVYSSQGPEFCDALKKRGQSKLHDPHPISDEEVAQLCALSPHCDYRGTCKNAQGESDGTTCASGADCGKCSDGSACSEDADCPPIFFTHIKNMGPYACETALGGNNTFRFVKQDLPGGQCSNNPNWICDGSRAGDDSGTDCYECQCADPSNAMLAQDAEKTCASLQKAPCGEDECFVCVGPAECPIPAVETTGSCAPRRQCDVRETDGNTGCWDFCGRNQLSCDEPASGKPTCDVAAACAAHEGTTWMGLCSASRKLCAEDADCGGKETCDLACYVTDPRVCENSGAGGTATTNRVATRVCSTTGREIDCAHGGDACGPGGKGKCMPLCGTCEGDRTCHNDHPTCSGFQCEARSEPRMHYTKFPYTFKATGPSFRHEVPGVASENHCVGRWDDQSAPGWQGKASWEDGKCFVEGPVDGGPLGVVVPVEGGAVPLTAASGSDCSEIGGNFDTATLECNVAPSPMVVHECVLGDIGHPDGSAARASLGTPVSAAELTPEQYEKAVRRCEGVGGTFDLGSGCRVVMPTLKPSQLYATRRDGGAAAVRKLVRGNRERCLEMGGTYFSHNLTYNEIRQTYDDGTRKQADCVKGAMGARRYCEVPTSRLTSKNRQMEGFYDVAPWVYHGPGVDPALTGGRRGTTCEASGIKGPGKVSLAMAAEASEVTAAAAAATIDRGFATCDWPSDSFPVARSETSASGGGSTTSVSWTGRTDWQCHATPAYCDRMEVDFSADPLVTDKNPYPGCVVSTAQGIFENIFGTTIVRNFRRDVIENSESAYKACGGGFAGAFCGTGAALGGISKTVGSDLADVGKAIGKGFKSLFCDPRLKDHPVPISADVLGLGVHLYLFVWNQEAERLGVAAAGTPGVGFLATEVRGRFPDLVETSEKGYLRLDLARLRAKIESGEQPQRHLRRLLFWSRNGARVGEAAGRVFDEYQRRFARAATANREAARRKRLKKMVA